MSKQIVRKKPNILGKKAPRVQLYFLTEATKKNGREDDSMNQLNF